MNGRINTELPWKNTLLNLPNEFHAALPTRGKIMRNSSLTLSEMKKAPPRPRRQTDKRSFQVQFLSDYFFVGGYVLGMTQKHEYEAL